MIMERARIKVRILVASIRRRKKASASRKMMKGR
jgi:hypothetical protein